MLFVKVENGKVTQVWDTQPPAGESGWKSAVEVRPSITNRQCYTGHTFDLTKDPVEIVYGVEEISVDGRKDSMKNTAKMEFQRVVQEETKKQTDEYPDTQYNAATVEAARLAFEAKVNAISAATTHDALDAL